MSFARLSPDSASLRGMADGFRRGLVAGALAGTVTAAAMYVAAAVTGLRTLPALLSDPVLALLPGPVFGLLIDTLQHLGKVLEELGLLLGMIAGLALLGGGHGWVRARRSPPPSHLGLLAGGLGWLFVVGVVLPLAGDGLLGLDEGIAAPVTWALLFAIYALVLDLGYPRRPDTDPGRRRVLAAAPFGLAAVAVVVLAARLVPGWYRAVAAAPESGLVGPVPALTPVDNFYVVSKNFTDPVVAAAGWSLNVHGLADAPYRLSYDAFKALPATTLAVTLECVSNAVGGNLISTGRFAGVPLRDLVQRAGPRPAAHAVAFRARDSYAESLPLDLILGDPDILVAHSLDGAPLPDAHGFPARLLIPGRYGMKGPKWLEDIELVASETGGYWEGQGWDSQAVVQTMSRIDSPIAGRPVPMGDITVSGVAFAGARGIARVEVSTDGGRTWTDADLQPPLGPLTWTLWSFAWRPAAEGLYTLAVRATDGARTVQPSSVRPSFPSGATGYDKVAVTISR
jgi:DMSO/TMAO reductase YedYZ molybdopterin-dependent catalytic subunit